MYAFLDFIDDLSDLFTTSDQQKEPEYDDFIRCFDQGLSEKEIKDRYNFQSVNDFADMTRMSVIGHGNNSCGLNCHKNRHIPLICLLIFILFLGDTISDPSNKTEVVMKLMKSHQKPRVQLGFSLSYKVEVKVYKDLKKGQFFKAHFKISFLNTFIWRLQERNIRCSAKTFVKCLITVFIATAEQ